MQNKSLIIGALIGLAFGVISGYVLGQMILSSAAEITRLSSLKTLLESKAVNGVNVFVSGKITAISGRNLTVEDKGGTWVVAVGEDLEVLKNLLIFDCRSLCSAASIESLPTWWG